MLPTHILVVLRTLLSKRLQLQDRRIWGLYWGPMTFWLSQFQNWLQMWKRKWKCNDTHLTPAALALSLLNHPKLVWKLQCWDFTGRNWKENRSPWFKFIRKPLGKHCFPLICIELSFLASCVGVLLFLPLLCDFKLCLAFLGFIISQIYFHDSHMKQLTCQNIDATVNRDLNWKICECVSHFCLLFWNFKFEVHLYGLNFELRAAFLALADEVPRGGWARVASFSASSDNPVIQKLLAWRSRDDTMLICKLCRVSMETGRRRICGNW